MVKWSDFTLLHVLLDEVIKGPRGIDGLGIEPGSPNMFVTSEGLFIHYSSLPNDIINTIAENVLTTTVLVYANDESKPLPTNEEVLLCTEHTTSEEVTSLHCLFISLDSCFTIYV